MNSQYISESTVNSEKTAARFPINRTYTQEQRIMANDFVFHAPSDWFSSRSPGKCIGLREARVIPWHGVISIRLAFETASGAEKVIVPGSLNISENDTMYEIVSELTTFVQESISNNYKVHVLTDYDGSVFRMQIVDENLQERKFHFVSTKEYPEDDVNLWLFATLFNQPPSYDVNELCRDMTLLRFENVWDRMHLYIHSSISTDHNQILCENNSRYEDPSSYLFPCSQPTIKIWFTTDTKRIIEIHECLFILKLSFIYNYKNAVM